MRNAISRLLNKVISGLFNIGSRRREIRLACIFNDVASLKRGVQPGTAHRLLLTALIVIGAASARAETPATLTYEEALQAVVDTYPSLAVAALQVEKARQEQLRVESSLGWVLQANGGLNRDITFLGTPSDVASVSAGLQRRFASGQSIGVKGRYRYEDSELVFSPVYPNPAHSTGIDLDYRIPLGRGKDNPDYTQGLASAEAGVLLEQANRLAVREQLARQLLELYYGLATVRASYETARAGVARAKRLKKYIQERYDMGLAEEKDRLQAEAQLRLQISELRKLEILWEQMRTNLNRLMGRPWKQEFVPRIAEEAAAKPPAEAQLPRLRQEAEANSPDLLRNRARLRLSEAELERRRDARRDQLDVVMSVGTRTLNGTSAFGDVGEQDLAGGVRLEYQNALDKRGFDAAIYQARLEIRAAEEDSRRVRDDLHYRIAGLVGELAAAHAALQAYEARLASEQRKFDEALDLYREGRFTTDRLIQFENELQAARFALEQQRIEYAQRQRELAILRGSIWQRIEDDPQRGVTP